MQRTLTVAGWIRLAMAACVAMPCAGPVRAACVDTYPDSQVTQRLAKDAYAACEFEVMRADYAGILKEQARLLGLLRPTYERALLKAVDLSEQGAQRRLEEFDVRLKELRALADGIAASAKAPGKAEKGKDAGDSSSAHKAQQKGREVSELLRVRIALARDSLQSEEADTYCKLDFYFRLGDGLNVLIRNCVK
jgi:hypothetical protein